MLFDLDDMIPLNTGDGIYLVQKLDKTKVCSSTYRYYLSDNSGTSSVVVLDPQGDLKYHVEIPKTVVVPPAPDFQDYIKGLKDDRRKLRIFNTIMYVVVVINVLVAVFILSYLRR